MAFRDLKSSTQVAEELGLDPTQVARLAREHGKGLKIGRNWLFTPADVRWFREHRPGMGRPPKS